MEQELDRNHDATPYKLEKARERGQVFKSADLAAAIVFLSAAVYFQGLGWQNVIDQFTFDKAIFQRLALSVGSDLVLWHIVEASIAAMLLLLFPLLLTVFIAAVIGNVSQSGFVFSGHPLKPDWTRINPASGFKRVFSMRSLFDTLRALVKLVVLSFIVYLSVQDVMPMLAELSGRPALAYLHLLADEIGDLCFELGLALLIISFLDFGFSRREFDKKMRMGQREVKDEVKHREGDPRIRAKLRELRREMLKKTLSLRKTGSADVLITNPTHLAVALRYEHGEMVSPLLVAKGAGPLAAAMREIAARKQIPVVRNRTLARALYYGVDLEQHVPPKLYADVARLIVWIMAIKKRREQPVLTGPMTVGAR